MDANTDLATVLHQVFTPSGAPGAQAVSAVDERADARALQPLIDQQTVAKVIDDANAELAHRQTGLRFVQHDALPRPLIQIVDQASGEVLRQIPNEAAVRIAQALTGLLIDHRA